MFLPSGRVHAIGAGLVIFEIQQNSDTTYRVFDWNRVGLDKKPRELHIAESLASIDFEDFEPALAGGKFVDDKAVKHRELVDNPLFSIDEFHMPAETETSIESHKAWIAAVVKGKLLVSGNSVQITLSPGEFGLIPADVKSANLCAESDCTFLISVAG
jgi:mannose-6-phosphate isomerase